MTIALYMEQLKNRQIIINPKYQRTDKVWPISAKSNLIDTILNGYPIPKIILSQTTDLETKKTRQEVVDGQQRSIAILEFFDGEFALTRGNFKGNRFDDLEPSVRQDFLQYPLSVDTFTSATDDDIREVFRRINSYQVPLNSQETRHATHQGELKWFIREFGSRYATSFVKMGTLTEKQISRMADLELITELAFLVTAGIKTQSQPALDRFYRDNDPSFPNRSNVEARLQFGLGVIIDTPELHGTDLVSRANLYALFAAFVAVQFKDEVLVKDLEQPDRDKPFASRATELSNLTLLGSAISESSEDEKFAPLVKAATGGTNTENHRRIRYRWFHKALTSEAL